MRVLLLTHRLPYPPNRGDRLRAFHIVRTLSATADLELVSLAHDDEELGHVEELRRLFPIRVTAVRTAPVRNYLRAAAALAGSRPLTHCLLDAPGFTAVLRTVARDRPPDVVLAYCSGMARFALEPPLNRYPFVLDFVDVDSEKWASMAGTATWPKRWIYQREARQLGRFECSAAGQAAANIVVNERERDVLSRLAPNATIRVVGIGVDLEGLRPHESPPKNARVVFCGVMNYPPNVEGVLWFAHEIWPLVIAKRPDAQFVVVGATPSEQVRRLGAEGRSIEVTGTVPDIREYLWGAAVSVAPLLIARGVQNKVLEALAAGLPTVVTGNVLDGLPTQVRAGCRVADSAAAFADEILSLLALSPSERRSLASTASLESIGWDVQLAALPGVIADAVVKERDQPFRLGNATDCSSE